MTQKKRLDKTNAEGKTGENNTNGHNNKDLNTQVTYLLGSCKGWEVRIYVYDKRDEEERGLVFH